MSFNIFWILFGTTGLNQPLKKPDSFLNWPFSLTPISDFLFQFDLYNVKTCLFWTKKLLGLDRFTSNKVKIPCILSISWFTKTVITFLCIYTFLCSKVTVMMVVQTLVLRRTIDVGPRRFSCLVVMVLIHYICKFIKNTISSSIVCFTFIPMDPLFQTNKSAS